MSSVAQPKTVTLKCTDGLLVLENAERLAADWKFFAGVTSGLWLVEDEVEVLYSSSEVSRFLSMCSGEKVPKRDVVEVVKYFEPTSDRWRLSALLPPETTLEEFRSMGAIAASYGIELEYDTSLSSLPYQDEVAILGVMTVAEDRDSTLVRVCRELGDYYHEALHAITGSSYKKHVTLEHINILLGEAIRATTRKKTHGVEVVRSPYTTPGHLFMWRSYKTEESRLMWIGHKREELSDFSPELHHQLYAHIVKAVVHLLTTCSSPATLITWLSDRTITTTYPSPLTLDSRGYWRSFETPTKAEVASALDDMKYKMKLPVEYVLLLAQLRLRLEE